MNELNEFEGNPYASPRASVSVGNMWAESGGPSLRRVALGVSFVYYGIVLVLLAIIVVVLGAILNGVLDNRMVLLFGAIAAVGMLVVAVILLFVGPIVCLAVPAERCKGLIRGSVICQLLNLGIGIGVQVAQRPEGNPMSLLMGANQGGKNVNDQLVPLSDFDLFLIAAQVFGNIIGCVAFILFVLFLKRLAQFIDRHDLAQRASSVLTAWFLFIILFVAGMFLSGLGRGGGLMTLLLLLVAGVAVLIMYAKLVDSTRKALVQPTSR